MAGLPNIDTKLPSALNLTCDSGQKLGSKTRHVCRHHEVKPTCARARSACDSRGSRYSTEYTFSRGLVQCHERELDGKVDEERLREVPEKIANEVAKETKWYIEMISRQILAAI